MTHRKLRIYPVLLALAAMLLSAGCAKKAAKVTPAAPPAAVPPAPSVATKPPAEQPKVAAVTPSPSDEDLFGRNVKDVFFDYNKSDIRPDETITAEQDAVFLRQHPNVKVLVEGHCDERGSIEYNLALGTSRAEAVKQALLQEGVSADRIRTISYGKEKPFCTLDDEQCWQQNRVDHFTFAH